MTEQEKPMSVRTVVSTWQTVFALIRSVEGLTLVTPALESHLYASQITFRPNNLLAFQAFFSQLLKWRGNCEDLSSI